MTSLPDAGLDPVTAPLVGPVVGPVVGPDPVTGLDGVDHDAPVAFRPAMAPMRRPAMIVKVVRDQRKAVFVAVGFMVASFWIIGQLGRWPLAGCVAGGVLLGLLNHLATEFWLLRTITAQHETTRGQMVVSTLGRLAVLTSVAVGCAVAFWPDGIGLLLGLAIFRLIALMMTSITLLKELKDA